MLSKLEPRRVTRILSVTVGCLAVVGIAVVVARHVAGYEWPALLNLFDPDKEDNVPTAYSAATLLASGLLLLAIARRTRRTGGGHVGHWAVLGVIFVGLAIDEAFHQHERLIAPLAHALHTRGIFLYAWVIPGVLFVVIVGLAYLGFVLHLPPATRRAFVAAGVVYVSGALGMEMVGGHYATDHTRHTLTYGLLTTVEELLEMAGIVIFIHGLLVHLRSMPPDGGGRDGARRAD